MMLDSPWLVAGIAFMFGLLIGWLIRDGRLRARDDEAADLDGRKLFDEEAGLDGNLATVISEMNKAKALIEITDETDAAAFEELEKLDLAIKRANGRLKLIAKSESRGTAED